MVTDITTKVLNSARDISLKNKTDEANDQIRVVSTFKADNNIVNRITKSEENFKQTPSFRNITGKLFTFVKKVGPNIKSKVNSLKHQALGTKKGGAVKCNGRGCKCCRILNSASFIIVNNKKIHLANGSCKSYNICYLALCDMCDKPYTGRTVGPLNGRINGHRHLYYDVLKNSGNLEALDTSSDLYTLGLHLHLEHGCSDPHDFDKHLKFAILEAVSPSNIDVKEFKWMHQLNSFQPIGINVEYPFGLPYLGQK